MSTLPLDERFDSGTDGSPITTGNSLADFVFGGPVFTSQALDGLAAKFSASNGKSYLYYTFSSVDELYLRWVVWQSALPASPTYIATVTGVDRVADMRLETDGKVSIRDLNMAVDTSNIALPVSTFSRIEWRVKKNTNQQLRLFIGSNVFGTTPDYDSGNQPFTQNAGLTQATYGFASTSTYEQVVDFISLTTTPWPALPSNALTVSVGAVYGTLVAGAETQLTANALDGDGLYTYAWTIQSGPDTSLSQIWDTTTNYTYFVPSTDGAYTLRCTATDGSGRTGYGEVNILATPAQRMVFIKAVMIESP